MVKPFWCDRMWLYFFSQRYGLFRWAGGSNAKPTYGQLFLWSASPSQFLGQLSRVHPSVEWRLVLLGPHIRSGRAHTGAREAGQHNASRFAQHHIDIRYFRSMTYSFISSRMTGRFRFSQERGSLLMLLVAGYPFLLEAERRGGAR